MHAPKLRVHEDGGEAWQCVCELMDRADLTLLIETPIGVEVRRIPNASPLRVDIPQGKAAEEATQDAAAVWGLPDFVLRAEVLSGVHASREIGDRLVLVGDLGLVVQVKSRDQPTDDPAKEQRWIEKHTMKALRQASGTIRRLKSGPVLLTNVRGRSIEVDGNTLRWISVVVLDHPHVPAGIRPATLDGHEAAAVILRRDWEFLFEHLKSTHAVARYFERVAGEMVDLGHEPARYFQLARADHQADPEPLSPVLLAVGGRLVSSPLLPMTPTGTERPAEHLLVRSIFEDIATSTMIGRVEKDRLAMLAELDRLPVSDRADIGRFLLAGLAAVSTTDPEDTAWRFRRVVLPLEGQRVTHLAFGVCSNFDEPHKWAFEVWVQLRHYDLQETVESGSRLTTVGVLLTPRTDGARPWDTTMVAVSSHIALTTDELATYRQLWASDAT